jgi:hypothetical protein
VVEKYRYEKLRTGVLGTRLGGPLWGFMFAPALLVCAMRAKATFMGVISRPRITRHGRIGALYELGHRSRTACCDGLGRIRGGAPSP